jgi:hypothetical protein
MRDKQVGPSHIAGSSGIPPLCTERAKDGAPALGGEIKETPISPAGVESHPAQKARKDGAPEVGERLCKLPYRKRLWNPTFAHRTRKDGAPVVGESPGL